VIGDAPRRRATREPRFNGPAPAGAEEGNQHMMIANNHPAEIGAIVGELRPDIRCDGRQGTPTRSAILQLPLVYLKGCRPKLRKSLLA
jgi:hypothetical protein